MIKLLIVAAVLATAYYWYRGQKLLVERRNAELEERERARRGQIIDVEAEVLRDKARRN